MHWPDFKQQTKIFQNPNIMETELSGFNIKSDFKKTWALETYI